MLLPRRKTTEEFIREAQSVYGDKYDYSKVRYENSQVKVLIICPDHGEFWVTPNNFLKGHKCPACSGRQRITKDVFISRSIALNGSAYDYSKINYVNAYTPVGIECPVHGTFWQKPKDHLLGNRCPKCFGSPKSTTEEFIRKARSIYGDRYDYSKVDYRGNKEKVCITCPEHGDWRVTPNNFLRGSRCPGCYGTPKHTLDEFVAAARKVHGKKYDYSRVKYDGLKRNVTIICPVHGEFLQSPAVHLKGCGCRACSGTLRITKDSFIQRSKTNHSIAYDYSKVSFKNGNEKVCIICPTHGEFWQSVHYHVLGGNCPKCAGCKKLTTEEFIEKAREIHGDKYDYSKVVYKNYSTKVCIICPDHGEFWQVPNNHLFGAGCPTCPQSNMEGEVRQFLMNNGIEFEQEKTFDWLRFKKKLFLDFYLPEYDVAIECQGGQHFFPTELFGGEEFYEKTLERDLAKRDMCEAHGIRILYYTNASLEEYPYPVIESLRLLHDAIKAHGKIDIPY